ncbi:acyl-CoA N-acyltransferase [Meredithblackwellia eburnea MCA 4105]
MSLDSLTFDWVSSSDLDQAITIEQASFPPEEAATIDSFKYRQSVAPSLFLGVFSAPSSDPSRKLIAFTCSTLSPDSTLTHHSMEHHDQDPKHPSLYAMIHSVCVHSEYRRKGLATALLNELVLRLKVLQPKQLEGRIKGARLITHDVLIPLYKAAGFTLVGESQVVHGPDKWYEMKVDFAMPPPNEVEKKEEEVHEKAAIIATEFSSTRRNPGELLATFPSVPRGVDGRNSKELFCLREECRCLLLPPLPVPISSLPSSDSAVPTLPPSPGYWSLPSPLSFENIGFTKTTSLSSPFSVGIKFLTCADCDTGPLGWHDPQGVDLGMEVERENEGTGGVREGRMFLLDAERVRYA